MPGIGLKAIRVSAAMLDFLLRRRGATAPRRFSDAELAHYYAALRDVPQDAEIVAVRCVDRNMVGRSGDEAGSFEYDLLWTHPSFAGDQDRVVRSPVFPQIPSSWDYAAPSAARAASVARIEEAAREVDTMRAVEAE